MSESLYEYMKQKLDEMYKNKDSSVVIDYAEFSKLFQLVCYMKQIKTLTNSVEC